MKIDGTFPDYWRIIPTAAKATAEVERASIRSRTSSALNLRIWPRYRRRRGIARDRQRHRRPPN
jgi:hypothetical protein